MINFYFINVKVIEIKSRVTYLEEYGENAKVAGIRGSGKDLTD
jgi:hypothetical protein